MAADGPAFVAAAVRAACLAKAPRRTVQAVAAAVAGVFAHPHASAKAATKVKVTPATQCTNDLGGHEDEDMPALIEALRSARRAQRRRKKERRRAAQSAVAVAPDTTAADDGGAGTAIAQQAPAASSLL